MNGNKNKDMETLPGQKYPHLIDIRDQEQDFEVPPDEVVTVLTATKPIARQA